ncbi:hypothetical protein ACFRVV_004371, partial [Shigella sonnei]
MQRPDTSGKQYYCAKTYKTIEPPAFRFFSPLIATFLVYSQPFFTGTAKLYRALIRQKPRLCSLDFSIQTREIAPFWHEEVKLFFFWLVVNVHFRSDFIVPFRGTAVDG